MISQDNIVRYHTKYGSIFHAVMITCVLIGTYSQKETPLKNELKKITIDQGSQIRFSIIDIDAQNPNFLTGVRTKYLSVLNLSS